MSFTPLNPENAAADEPSVRRKDRNAALPADQVGPLKAERPLVELPRVDQLLEAPGVVSGPPDLEDLPRGDLVALLAGLLVIPEYWPWNPPSGPITTAAALPWFHWVSCGSAV